MNSERETTDEAGGDQLPDWASRWPGMLQLIMELSQSAPGKAEFLARAVRLAAELDSSTRLLESVLDLAVKGVPGDANHIANVAQQTMINAAVLRDAGYQGG